MNCVILQPSYIPWRGYFHQIQMADLFIFYDDVQYDSRGWRHRNRIKTMHGPRWLSIPVHHRGSQTAGIPIKDIRICWDDPWSEKHLESLRHAYRKAPLFSRYLPLLETHYAQRPTYLADFTIDFTIALARELGITNTRFARASEFAVEGEKTDRLLALLKKVGATHYISGPSAKSYIEHEKFDSAGISVEFMEYAYPEYPQLYPPFDPQVSVLDLLMMTGSEAAHYIWDSPPISPAG